MAKCFRTIYFDAAVFLEAEKQHADFNGICNEALRLFVNRQANEGTTAGALGNYIQDETNKQKNIEIMRKLGKNRDEKFNKNLKIFCEAYHLTPQEALKLCGL